MADALYRGECRLKRWNDGSTTGRTITLEIDSEGVHPFKGYEGERFAVMIVPLGNDDQPMKKDSSEGVVASPPGRLPAGAAELGSNPGPRSKSKKRWNDMPLSQRAALLTKDPVFWSFLESTRRADRGCDERRADEALKGECAVFSKAEIRESNNEGRRFLKLESNFLAWKQAVQHGAA